MEIKVSQWLEKGLGNYGHNYQMLILLKSISPNYMQKII